MLQFSIKTQITRKYNNYYVGKIDFQSSVSNEHVLRNHMAIKFQISSFLSQKLHRFKITYFWDLFLLLLLLILSTSQHSTGNERKYCSYPWPVLNKVLNKIQYQMLLVLTWHWMLYKHRTHYRHGSHNVRLMCFQSWGVNYKTATLWEDLWGYLHNHNQYHFQKCQSANFANCMELEEADFCQIFYN